MSRRLKAQAGTDEANFGGSRFPVNTDGVVEVPDDAAAALVAVGGFVDITDAAPNLGEANTSPVCRMMAPDNSGPVTWGGVVYEVVEGVVAVPPAASGDLEAHGFILVKD